MLVLSRKSGENILMINKKTKDEALLKVKFFDKDVILIRLIYKNFYKNYKTTYNFMIEKGHSINIWKNELSEVKYIERRSYVSEYNGLKGKSSALGFKFNDNIKIWRYEKWLRILEKEKNNINDYYEIEKKACPWQRIQGSNLISKYFKFLNKNYTRKYYNGH